MKENLSKDVLAYWKEIGKELTDFEKAVLIYEFSDGWEAICSELVDLMRNMEDEILQHQIKEHIEYEEQVVAEVKQDCEDVVFIVFHYDYDDKARTTDGLFVNEDWYMILQIFL